MSRSTFLHWLRENLAPVALAMVTLGTIVTFGFLYYANGSRILDEQLRSRLSSTAALAAMQFRAEDLTLLRTKMDMDRPEYTAAVRLLDRIRAQSPSIRYAYILRHVEGGAYEFVADADSLAKTAIVDLNGDGVLDESDEPTFPGMPYDLSDVPEAALAAESPQVTAEPYSDQWGTFMTGFAPIRDPDGETVAILGVDMELSHLRNVSIQIFSPAAIMLAIFAATGLALYSVLAWSRRHMADLRRADDERASLLKLAYHQLGQPLTILKWSHELLVEKFGWTPSDPDLKEHIEREADAIQRFSDIFRALERAERISEDQLRYEAKSIALVSIVNEVLEKVQPRLERRKQRVEVSLEADLRVSADPALVAGALEELVRNAGDFSPDGSAIRILASAAVANAVIRVMDDGCGIPAGDLRRLLTQFTHKADADAMRSDGTGLGLYVAKGIIERGGGHIGIESVVGKGTTVTMTLPLA